MPYTASYFGLSTADLNYLRQQAVKFVLGRHWIEAEIFPYILRYTGVSVLLDPALSATVAATGLYFREGNRYEDLWIEHSDSTGCNLRRRAIVRDLLQLWVPYIQLSDIATALTDQEEWSDRSPGPYEEGYHCWHGCCSEVTSSTENYQRGVEFKVSRLSGLIWVSRAPKKWCNGVARFTLLRWAVNQDDDTWLTLRRYTTQPLMWILLATW